MKKEYMYIKGKIKDRIGSFVWLFILTLILLYGFLVSCNSATSKNGAFYPDNIGRKISSFVTIKDYKYVKDGFTYIDLYDNYLVINEGYIKFITFEDVRYKKNKDGWEFETEEIIIIKDNEIHVIKARGTWFDKMFNCNLAFSVNHRVYHTMIKFKNNEKEDYIINNFYMPYIFNLSEGEIK
jgi:hypothetical protein